MKRIDRAVAILVVAMGLVVPLMSCNGQQAQGVMGIFGMGLRHVQINDRIVSPVRSDGIAFALSLGAEYEINASRHALWLRGGFGELANRYDLPVVAFDLRIGYGYLRRIVAEADGSWSLHGGATLSWGTAVQFYSLLDESHLYWMTATELGVKGSSTWRMGDRARLAVDLGLPISALVSRPPEERYYNNDQPNPSAILDLVHSRSRLSGPLDYSGFDIAASYSFDLSDRLVEEIQYRGSYRWSASPVAAEFLDNTLCLSLRYRF